MLEEGLMDLLEITQIVEIIMRWYLRSRRNIKKMLRMVSRHYISVDFVNDIPIREYIRKKIDQTSKYTILKNDG